jgi:hypothetical protein
MENKKSKNLLKLGTILPVNLGDPNFELYMGHKATGTYYRHGYNIFWFHKCTDVQHLVVGMLVVMI